VNRKDAIIGLTADPEGFPNELAMVGYEMIVFVLHQQRLAVPDGIALPLQGLTNPDCESRLPAEWICRRKQKRRVAKIPVHSNPRSFHGMRPRACPCVAGRHATVT
jgi:hypothetical protein